MWTILINFFLDISRFASAIPGHTTAGRDFVFGCYSLKQTQIFTARLTILTHSLPAMYEVWQPNNYNNGIYRVQTTYVRHTPAWSYDEYKLPDICKVKGTGKYQSYRLTASVPIQVIFQMDFGSINQFLETFKLVPKESCFHKYYITTSHGYPFMAVHAFQYTNIIARFGQSTYKYNELCFGDGDQKCSPTKVVSGNLNSYQFWFFLLNTEDGELHNTIIESDNPVFVVAGNLFTKIAKQGADIMVSTMKPTVAWGKIYIVPHFFGETTPIEVFFRINAETFPFTLNLTKGSSEGDVTQISANKENVVISEKIRQPVALSATMPFGLHAMMPTTTYPIHGPVGDASLINIIPAEQWMNGFFRMKDGFDSMGVGDKYTFVVLSTAQPKDVFFDFKHVSSAPHWKQLGTVNSITFYFTYVTAVTDWKVYVKNTHLKLMFYVRYQPFYYTSTAFPYDFYQGEISEPYCTKVIPVISDGVDNDCDGFIDEEIRNNEDDDGDGEIDEDLVEAYQSGQWAAWAPSCYIWCEDQEVLQYTRECINRSMFGDDCLGDNQMCGSNETCPKSCSGGDIQRLCACKPTCSECRNDSAACFGCISGYYNSTYCLDKCPFGWTGVGCTRGPRTLDDFAALEQLEETTTKHLWRSLHQNQFPWTLPTVALVTSDFDRSHLWLVVVLALFLFGAVFCFGITTRRRRRSLYILDAGQESATGLSETENREEEVGKPWKEASRSRTTDVQESDVDSYEIEYK